MRRELGGSHTRSLLGRARRGAAALVVEEREDAQLAVVEHVDALLVVLYLDVRQPDALLGEVQVAAQHEVRAHLPSARALLRPQQTGSTRGATTGRPLSKASAQAVVPAAAGASSDASPANCDATSTSAVSRSPPAAPSP